MRGSDSRGVPPDITLARKGIARYDASWVTSVSLVPHSKHKRNRTIPLPVSVIQSLYECVCTPYRSIWAITYDVYANTKI